MVFKKGGQKMEGFELAMILSGGRLLGILKRFLGSDCKTMKVGHGWFVRQAGFRFSKDYTTTGDGLPAPQSFR